MSVNPVPLIPLLEGSASPESENRGAWGGGRILITFLGVKGSAGIVTILYPLGANALGEHHGFECGNL